MFRRLTFHNQVMLLPIAAGIAFLILAMVSIVLGVQNGIALQRIETEFSPAEKNSRRMLATLIAIQRRLQDAVLALDEDLLNETKSERATFLNLIQSAKRNPIQKPREIERIKKAFIQYFDISYDTSRRMVFQAESEGLTESIGIMSQRYVTLKSMLEKRVELSEQKSQDFLISLARSAARRPIYINIPIIVAALLITLFLARSIAAGAVKSLNEASGRLTAASSQLLSLAEQTETNVESVAAAVSEIRYTMDGMLEAANEVDSSANTVLKSADRSVEASITIGKQIGLLNEQAFKISDISQEVRAISDTSNMLALNASLEGSKAGEVGKGFAYISKEMRRLTDTITAAVQNIQQLSVQIREFSQAAVSASNDGHTLAVETTDTAKQITVIATRQRNATVQITEAIEDMKLSSQNVVRGAIQAKHTARNLVRTADNLRELVTGKDADPYGRH